MDRELTFGEKAVGLSFNPSGDPTVQKIKELHAEIIDLLVQLPVTGDGIGIKSEMIDHAIREQQTAQMWAVKVATWND